MEARHIFLFHRIDINSSSGTDEMWGLQHFFRLLKNYHSYLKHGMPKEKKMYQTYHYLL
jgi:hypothetical protein